VNKLEGVLSGVLHLLFAFPTRTFFYGLVVFYAATGAAPCTRLITVRAALE
jgi:hypothetical protein